MEGVEIRRLERPWRYRLPILCAPPRVTVVLLYEAGPLSVRDPFQTLEGTNNQLARFPLLVFLGGGSLSRIIRGPGRRGQLSIQIRMPELTDKVDQSRAKRVYGNAKGISGSPR